MEVRMATAVLNAERVRQAADTIKDRIAVSPCSRSSTLSQITGADVVLKFENLHFTGSFKERGALVKLLSLTPAESRKGVVAMSAGNHAQGVAYHARRLGVPAVIVMPRFTPNVKVQHTRDFGAEVILEGNDFDESAAAALALAEDRGLTVVHPFDDPAVMAGQGTVALEMLAAFPRLDVLVVPVGGGGLMAGCATIAKHLRPDIRLVGVQAVNCPAMVDRWQEAPSSEIRPTIAEGIAVKAPGSLTFGVIRRLVDDMLVVAESDIEEAVRLLLEVEKTVVEGAGAAGLAALLKNPEKFKQRQVGIVLSGGNIDMLILSSIIQRGLVRSGRLVRLTIGTRDVPGSLAAVTRLIADAEANIIEIVHQRAFSQLPVQSAEVQLVLQTRGQAHVQQVVRILEKAGYQTARH
jgi:threonine dehydratase